MTIALVILLATMVAAVNGANDVSKGIATLAGSGTTRYRTAVVYGAITTLAGSIIAIWLGTAMRTLFADGIVETEGTGRFAIASLAGVAAWVAVATVYKLPVSTTHALVGALIGAGLFTDAAAIHWQALVTKIAIPLLASAILAYLLSAGLAALFRKRDQARMSAMTLPLPPLADAKSTTLTALHWFSAGAVGLARGLNDTPKIAAVAGFSLIPIGVAPSWIIVGTGIAMFAGATIAGGRVARKLGADVVPLDHAGGLRANLATALLVGPGAAYGLPMSTTHVSVGAIAGTVGPRAGRLNMATLRGFVVAWTVTPLAAGVVAAAVVWALSTFA